MFVQTPISNNCFAPETRNKHQDNIYSRCSCVHERVHVRVRVCILYVFTPYPENIGKLGALLHIRKEMLIERSDMHFFFTQT